MTAKKDYSSHFSSLGDRDWEGPMFGGSKPDFVPGLILCERFSHEVVEPIMRRRFPQVKFASVRIDYGSDVLGFDTELSRDHAWAPQTTIIVSPADFSQYRQQGSGDGCDLNGWVFANIGSATPCPNRNDSFV